jgi:hypothetical protein
MLASVERAHPSEPLRVVDAGGETLDHTCGAQVGTQRDDGVSGLDGSGRDLGKERLVGHVSAGIDDRDLRLVPAHVLLQPPGGVEAGVAAAHDEDLSHVVPPCCLTEETT